MGAQFRRLDQGEVAVGKALAWPLFDGDHRLLFPKGAKILSEHQLKSLLGSGLYCRLEDVEPARPAAAQAREDIRQLDEVRLGIGDALQIQSLAEGEQGRHYVKLIGYVKGRAVIVTTPTAAGQPMLVREGQGFVVRLFSGKSVYAFSTVAKRSTNVPFPHLFLDYPREVRGLVVRQGARARVQIIAAVQNQLGQSNAATIVDLSVGGAMLTAKGALAERNAVVSIKFRVEINGVEQFLKIGGIVRNVRAETHDDGVVYLHGVQFAALEPADQVALSGFVYQRLFEETSES